MLFPRKYAILSVCAECRAGYAAAADDLYCDSCDPDGNNIEGDQRSSGGKITDRNGDGSVDEDDWEQAWKDYLNDKMNG